MVHLSIFQKNLNCYWILTIVLILITNGSSQSITLKNPTSQRYEDEIFRLPIEVPANFKGSVLENGKAIPFIVDEWQGKKVIYVKSQFQPGEVKEYKLKASSEPYPSSPSLVRVQELSEGSIMMDNGQVAVKIPNRMNLSTPLPPLLKVKIGDQWIGESQWVGLPKLREFTVKVIDKGLICGKIRLLYSFFPESWTFSEPYIRVDLSLYPNRPFLRIEEEHWVSKRAAWNFEFKPGWKEIRPLLRAYSEGMGNTKRASSLIGTLKSGQIPFQSPELLLNLIPRWNQHCKDGWFLGIIGANNHLFGVAAVLAGEWYYPHDNAIQCLTIPSEDGFRLHAPNWRGKRVWYLIIGNSSLEGQLQSFLIRYAYETLDTIFQTVPVLEWEGASGEFKGYWPLSSQINPTGPIRSWGKECIKNIENWRKKKDLGRLTQTQILFSPHTYGSYWLFWSPENPNFFTDFNKVPIAMTCSLKDHPRFLDLAKIAVDRFREDLYHSIALPSGAGNECPGYQMYALKHYLEISKIIKDLGEDPLTWPWLKAAGSFLFKISQPLGGGKRGLYPGGDTHPNYVFNPPWEILKEIGIQEEITKMGTEELANFGVVFRYKPGTEQETFFIFKSGPARGHYHGDQLSFHYCENAQPRVVDHHCSYNPRAGQEHMHNRLSFSTDRLPYANMDGYERILAFKKGKRVSIAVGQVESWRLRAVTPLPPEEWHQEYPQHAFQQKPLRYRRTVVHITEEPRDYFVIRDQYDAEISLKATYNLHVYGSPAKQQNNKVDFQTLQLLIIKPNQFQFSNFEWQHNNGQLESTVGCRLSVEAQQGEFITVIYPGSQLPPFQLLPNGILINQTQITFQGDFELNSTQDNFYVQIQSPHEQFRLTREDINFQRFQGEIGLFVPDAGYPFGEIPEWLLEERIQIPSWAPEWVKAIRKQDPYYLRFQRK